MKTFWLDFNTHLRSLFGERVQKITVDAGLTCPNRDGTLGTGGCIYCNEKGSGTGGHAAGLSITEQLEQGKAAMGRRYKARRFLAYFQSFSNTYAPIGKLRRMYEEALAVDGVVGLCIGTRPDCVDEGILDMLQAFARDKLIWIEYGLQSAHDETLRRINRGHDAEAFEKAVLLTKNRGIRICAHVILGLPGEIARHMRETADFLAGLGVDGIKVHLLYVVRGTPLEAMYRRGDLTLLSREEYADRVVDFLERTPANVVIQRVTGDPHPEELAAPQWSLDKAAALAAIRQAFVDRKTFQGRIARSGG